MRAQQFGPGQIAVPETNPIDGGPYLCHNAQHGTGLIRDRLFPQPGRCNAGHSQKDRVVLRRAMPMLPRLTVQRVRDPAVCFHVQ
jgi:hypothetical protein